MDHKILIVSGEPSGDLHASNLVRDIKKLNPNVKFFGMGGSLSRGCGVDVVFDISRLALVGLLEVLKNIFIVKKAYETVLAKVDSERPDLAILVDYPGFNLRLARDLHRRSIPVIYYISPQVWAWGRDRINIIKKYVKVIIVFFKFEEELYRTYNINAAFVGHPLIDIVKVSRGREDTFKKYSLSEEKTTIALLPGSRPLEVNNLLSLMISASGIVADKLKTVQFIIAKHPDLPIELYKNALKGSGIEVRIAEGDAYNVLSIADFAIVASGTATLESAIIGTPLIIVYRASLLTFLLYKIVIRIPFLGIVNIIARKEVAPELLQFNATTENIAAKTLEIIGDKNRLKAMREDLRVIRSSLGASGASQRAAGIVAANL